MPRETQGNQIERSQTNESLRVERESADDAFRARMVIVNAAADAVIVRARARARDVIERARWQADEVLARGSTTSKQSATSERADADRLLHEEQVEAECVLRAEQAEQMARRVPERQDTDSSLRTERIHSDAVLATRDEVLGVVSHELRNMLHSMIGFAELIELGLAHTNRIQPQMVVQAQHIRRSGARMDRLIGDLVDVACIESGVLTMSIEAADPWLVVQEAVEAFQEQAAASGIALTATMAPPGALAHCDPARVLQVLVNLLSNALKFTAEKGRIVVRLERRSDDVQIAITDTGCGVPAERLELVFERFWQGTHNDRRGVGLGLYISKRIILAQGGRIWVESAPGAGSTFFVTLPCSDKRAS